MARAAGIILLLLPSFVALSLLQLCMPHIRTHTHTTMGHREIKQRILMAKSKDLRHLLHHHVLTRHVNVRRKVKCRSSTQARYASFYPPPGLSTSSSFFFLPFLIGFGRGRIFWVIDVIRPHQKCQNSFQSIKN